MTPSRNRTPAAHSLAVIILAIVVMRASAQDSPPSAAEQLQSAVQLFNEGDHVGALHSLNQIAVGRLDDAGRTTHEDYLRRASAAVSMFQKAETDFEAGSLALSDGRRDDALGLFRAVVENEFAANLTRRAAESELAKADPARGVAPRQGESTDAVSPDLARQRQHLRARVLTRDAVMAVEGGEFAEAERLFHKALQQVPGYPEAVDGLEQLRTRDRAAHDARSLIERIKERNAIAWQRTVSTYRAAEREIRDYVLGNRFEEAAQTVLRAKQIIEAGKSFADPVGRYQALIHEVEALSKYVDDEDRRFNEQEVARQRGEARREQVERLRRTQRNKQERINSLMTQAIQHRDDGDFSSSINVLRQIVAIDPTNDNARWLKEIVEDQQAFAIQREIRDETSRQTRDVLIDTTRSKIPWWQDITYPKNWLEIINRPSRARPGSEGGRPIDPNLQSNLDQPVRIDFDREPFEQVIEHLASANGTNISVSWSDLNAASIDPKTPVTLKWPNPVPMRTALSEILDQVGGGRADLGYRAGEGIVKVATRELLDRTVFEEVYNVSDLLMPVPDFTDAPTMDLTDSASFVGRGQSLPTGAGSGQSIFPSEYGEASEEVIEDAADALISLIRQTINPDSWRANNGDVGSITEINGQLVITQTPTGHARVGGLLSKLREQRAIQVALEARFITVQSNYLEEMGMDLDIILNAGNAGFDFLQGSGGNILADPVLGSRLLLPRSFSRLGFTPGTPGVGTALAGGAAGLTQPFNSPGLVPTRGNSSIGGTSGTPVPLINNILQFTDPGRLTSDLPGSFAGNPTLQPALNIFGSFLDNIQVDFLVRATQADSRTSIITAPRLVLFNGQRAWVAVVNQQSFVSSLQPIVDATGQAPLISTIETGAVLDAQVTVSADKRYVTMTLRPSVGRLLGIQTFAFSTGAAAGEGAFVQLPNISRQVLRTTVTVPDGGTLLIGGQKLAGEIEVESGVPILSKIPVLKRLYSSRTLVRDEQVLLILIKPKIIIQSEAEQEAFPAFGQR